MAQTLSGFDFWTVRFGESGRLEEGGDELRAQLPGSGVADLFVFSHGWNNDAGRARRLYERFFGQVGRLLDSTATVGVAGVFWPSMRWPDETDPEAAPDAGGASSFGAPALGDQQLVASLKDVFPGREQLLDELGGLLETRPPDQAQLARFQGLLVGLSTGPDIAGDVEDNQESALASDPPEQVFGRAARQARVRGGVGAAAGGAVGPDAGGAAIEDVGGAAGLGFGRLWEGAKHALRQATYWEMKKRAGRVGTDGLGPLLRDLHERAPQVRLHLIGHSFGARVVSFALRGLGDPPPTPSPVKSVLLIQGAFSHYAFADSLPHDPGRAGGLAGMQRRVDGPLLVTHSVHDLAVGRMYPTASVAARQDAAGLEEWMARWGAMGHDGAQSVGAAAVTLGEAGTAYDLRPGAFLNLDSGAVIRAGRPPSGAHSDIFHPELAWAALAAAGLGRAAQTR